MKEPRLCLLENRLRTLYNQFTSIYEAATIAEVISVSKIAVLPFSVQVTGEIIGTILVSSIANKTSGLTNKGSAA